MDTTMHGFRLVSSSELKEIKGTADIYKHDKSGLTMVHLNCADTNKAFALDNVPCSCHCEISFFNPSSTLKSIAF